MIMKKNSMFLTWAKLFMYGRNTRKLNTITICYVPSSLAGRESPIPSEDETHTDEPPTYLYNFLGLLSFYIANDI